jgi:hypothetical protein
MLVDLNTKVTRWWHTLYRNPTSELEEKGYGILESLYSAVFFLLLARGAGG